MKTNAGTRGLLKGISRCQQQANKTYSSHAARRLRDDDLEAAALRGRGARVNMGYTSFNLRPEVYSEHGARG